MLQCFAIPFGSLMGVERTRGAVACRVVPPPGRLPALGGCSKAPSSVWVDETLWAGGRAPRPGGGR